MTRRSYSEIKCFHASEDSFTVVSVQAVSVVWRIALYVGTAYAVSIGIKQSIQFDLFKYRRTAEITWWLLLEDTLPTHMHLAPSSIFLFPPPLSSLLLPSPLLGLYPSSSTATYVQDFGAHVADEFQASTPRAFDIMHLLKIYIQQQHFLDEVHAWVMLYIISTYTVY